MSEGANEVVYRGFNNLLQLASGPYIKVSVQWHTVKIEEHDIPNTIYIDILKLSFSRTQVTNATYEKPFTLRKNQH